MIWQARLDLPPSAIISLAPAARWGAVGSFIRSTFITAYISKSRSANSCLNWRFSRSISLRRRTSYVSMPAYLRFQRPKVFRLITWSRHTCACVF